MVRNFQVELRVKVEQLNAQAQDFNRWIGKGFELQQVLDKRKHRIIELECRNEALENEMLLLHQRFAGAKQQEEHFLEDQARLAEQLQYVIMYNTYLKQQILDLTKSKEEANKIFAKIREQVISENNNPSKFFLEKGFATDVHELIEMNSQLISKLQNLQLKRRAALG